MEKNKQIKKKFGYKEAFILASIFPLAGFLLEIITGSKGIKMPHSPYNVYLLLFIVLLAVFTHLFLSDKYFFKQLSSVPVSIAQIVVFTFIVLIMAFVPQTNSSPNKVINLLGLNHISKNWAFVFSSVFLLYTLGLVILRRVKRLNFRNIVFALNHIGLWIIIAIAGFGSGDLMRLKMEVRENSQPEWRATDGKKIYELPIAIKLIDFDIDEFNPEIALVDNNTGKVVVDEKTKVRMIEQGGEYFLKDYKIKVKRFYKMSMRIDTNYVEFPDVGATPAAEIDVQSSSDKLLASGWISAENYMMSPKLVWIDDKYSIGLLPPSPQRYSSHVILFSKDGTMKDLVIEVNKPVKFKGWKIYQVSYDESKGKWSETSVLELVRDPWITFVYIGIFMLLAGSTALFWIGKNDKK